MMHVDLTHMTEDQRVAAIAAGIRKLQAVGFAVENEPAKADRYLDKIRKLTEFNVRLRVEVPNPPGRGLVLIILQAKQPDPAHN